MATTTTKLVVTFTTASGTMTWSVNQFDIEADAEDVYDFVDAVVTNGDIFKNVPLAVKSVKYQTTTSNDIARPE